MFNTKQQTSKRKLNIYNHFLNLNYFKKNNDNYNFLRLNYLLIKSYSFFYSFNNLVIQLMKKFVILLVS